MKENKIMMNQVVQEIAKDMARNNVSVEYQDIENAVVGAYKATEDFFVGGYKKMETGIVTWFENIMDKCIMTLFARTGETLEQTKGRLAKATN